MLPSTYVFQNALGRLDILPDVAASKIVAAYNTLSSRTFGKLVRSLMLVLRIVTMKFYLSCAVQYGVHDGVKEELNSSPVSSNPAGSIIHGISMDDRVRIVSDMYAQSKQLAIWWFD